MKKRYIVPMAALLVLAMDVSGQNAIKLDKQQTNFFYTQINTHVGFMSDVNGERWDLANRGPDNQIVFQWKNKDKKRLQKGYVPAFGYQGFNIKAGVAYKKEVTEDGYRTGGLRLRVVNTFLKFGTKWDRTKLDIGVKSIPYGHNPKLDPVSSFATNLIKMDLGLVQDLGLFFISPISKNMDLEMSLSSGGFLNTPFLVCDNLVNYDNPEETTTTVDVGQFSYDNTWLITSRIGSPSYDKSELGLVAVAGRLNNTNLRNDLIDIARIGGDWVYKHEEKLKFSSLATVGRTYSRTEGEFLSLNFQTALDLYLSHEFVVSGSFAVNDLSSMGSSDSFHRNNTTTCSLTYRLSPHTRIRINSYYTYVKEAKEEQYGTFLQLVTGFGKR